MNGFGEFFADHGVLPGEFGIAGQRFFDAAGIARAQSARRMPWQQHFYFTGLLVQHLLVRRHHGQPRSMPAAFSSSANFLRAYNRRVFTVFSGMPTISATSSTDCSW